MKKLIIILFFVLLILPTTTRAEVGQSGQEFDTLKSGVGARALGMGGAFTAISDNADAPYWNPAGLANINFSEITSSQTRMSTDADHYYMSYVTPLPKGALGVSWIQIGTGDLQRTASPDASKGDNEVQNLGIFQYFSNAFLLSYGANLTQKVSAGLTAKYLSRDLGQTSSGEAHGYSVTPALLMKPSDRLSLGLKIDELVNECRWGTGTIENAPPRLCLGLAVRPLLPRISGLFSLDFSQMLKDGYAGTVSAGYEWESQGLALRAGYADSALSAGAGFESGVARVDYAYVQQNQLSRNNVHRISLSGRW